MIRALTVGAVSLLLLVSLYALSQAPAEQAPKKPAPSATQSKPPAIDKSPAAQAKRKDLIQRLIGERVFVKLDTPGNLPRIHVGPRFHTLPFDQKQSFVGVVYAYAFDGADDLDMVRVFDGRTNKSIGTFLRTRGLELD